MKTSTTTIRRAAQPDRPELDRFAREVVPEVYGPLVDDSYARRVLADWWLDSLDPAIVAGRVFVAVEEDVIVGLAEVDRIGDDPVLWKLYVDERTRNRGLGARLLQTVVDDLPPGAERLLLEHIAANTDAARFYEREGFEVIRVDEASDPRISLVWRSLSLRRYVDPMARHVGAMREEALAESGVLQDIAHWLTAKKKPRHVVDLGCGIGNMSALLATKTGAMITAVDDSVSMLEETMWTARTEGVPSQVDTLKLDISEPWDHMTLPLADLVWASSSIHHLADEVGALERIRSILKPHGRLALAEGGLTTRMLPFDLGHGRPGLETRIQRAAEARFIEMRSALSNSVEPGEGWTTKLEKAGYWPVTSRSFLLDNPAPLSGDLRGVVTSRLAHASEHLHDFLAEDDLLTLADLTDPDSPHFVAGRDDIYFLGVRTVYLAGPGS